MSLMNFIKKKSADADHIDTYAELAKHEVLVGTFDQAAELSGGKKTSFDAASYPEAISNLDKLVSEKSDAGTLDLDGCRISVFLSKTHDHVPALLLYIDKSFVGAKIAGSERSSAVYNAFKEHRITALNVEINHADYTVDLVMHEAE